MKIPYWLRKLLPMWDYICPKCKKEVPKNSHKCPYCNERYGKPLNVPPQCLKSKEALEKYVHENVFPRVSAWQRKYLAQYFTVIFQDGFESGDFSAWDGTGGAITIQSQNVHHGNYAVGFPGDPGVTYYCYKNISPINEVYHRVYWRFEDTPPYNGCNLTLWAGMANGETGLAAIAVINDAGTLKWRLSVRLDDGTYANGYSTTPSILANNWYCVEVYWRKSSAAGANNGEARLYINGALIITLSNLDNDLLSCNRIFEWYFQQNGWGIVIPSQLDCVVVADTGPIGTEGPPPAQVQLVISATAGGTTNPAPGTYTVDQNSQVQVTAIASSGYQFDHWELDGENIGATNPITVVMDTNHTLLAVFTQITAPTHILTVNSTPIQGVTFTIERVS